MASVCFVYVCDVHHIGTRGLCMLLAGGRRDNGQGYPPSPFQGRATVRLPPSKFFYFSKQIFYFFSTLPHNIIYSPIFFPSERFSLPLRVFPYPCTFSCLWGQKTGKIRITFLILSVSVWLLYTLFSFYILVLCYFLLLCYVLVLSFVVDAVFFADLPILLPSVGLSLLLCVIIRLGVFRGSEEKKNRFLCCGWVVCIRKKKGGRDFLSVPSALCLWLVISCVGMMLCCCVG